jgi:hypothetical protein
MNTTLKGDSFEQRIRNVISSLIEKSDFRLVLKGMDEMWIVPKDSKTFNKKKYVYPYGRDVVIDVSIELCYETILNHISSLNMGTKIIKIIYVLGYFEEKYHKLEKCFVF